MPGANLLHRELLRVQMVAKRKVAMEFLQTGNITFLSGHGQVLVEIVVVDVFVDVDFAVIRAGG